MWAVLRRVQYCSAVYAELFTKCSPITRRISARLGVLEFRYCSVTKCVCMHEMHSYEEHEKELKN